MIREQVLTLLIENESDVGICRRKSVSAAKSIGFDEVKTGEIAILVTELVTNVLKHGGGQGKILVCNVKNENQKGFEVWCCDMGKGISNFKKALTDGYSDKISLGIGLGSIRRFSDELEINPETKPLANGSGLTGLEDYKHCIRCLKWVPTKNWIGTNRNLTTGAISISKQNEKLNGDTYVINHISPAKTLAAVIDGLGHGTEAHLASQLAKEQILQRTDLPLDSLLKHLHDSLRGTRGVVIGIILIDTDKNKLQFSGIGNIEGVVFADNEKKSLLSFGGIIGHNMRTPRVFEFDFNPNDFVCLFSDGITARWSFSDVNWKNHPQQNAEYIITNFSRQTDDATVLIIRYNS